jgi:hypothetical protein
MEKTSNKRNTASRFGICGSWFKTDGSQFQVLLRSVKVQFCSRFVAGAFYQQKAKKSELSGTAIAKSKSRGRIP